MTLDELVFQNFGVYRGRQSFVLTPPSADKPIVLIGGLNGGGKTTLMDGLQLALYGKNARCSNRGELGYEDFLRRSIHNDVDPHQGATIEITFHHTTDGRDHKYRLQRSWSENGKGVKERVEIHRDGSLDHLLTDQWSEQVEAFVPLGISDLFFFDGEKIEQFADIQNASRVLSTAIQTLLGIELVDQLAADLIVLERRKRLVARNHETKKQIAELQQDIQRLEELHGTTFLQRGSVQNELDIAEKALHKVKERFRVAGGELFVQREQILGRKGAVEALVRDLERELCELAAGAAPLLLVQDLLASAVKQAQKELEVQNSKLFAKFLKSRDARLIQRLRSAGGANRLVEVAEKFCANDREECLSTSQTPCYLHLTAKAQDEAQDFRRTVLPEIKNRVDQLTSRFSELNEDLIRLEKQLAAVPDSEALEAVRSELQVAEHANRETKARIANLDARLAQLQNEKDRKQKDLETLLLHNVDEQIQFADDVRILHHSEKVRNTLEKFRVAVVQRHVSRIEQLMLDSFQRLLHKQSLVSEIRIHPENFELDLRGGDFKPISPNRLSAGERQLLAVSMLWGLARASGRSLPTIIDTPLGRLDASHRNNIVERYFPHASHQVVLLSTDEEIDEQFFRKLRPQIGRTYRLQFHEQTKSTEIGHGYFWPS
jgi:DNA sulfur modification protein DndD